MIALAVVGAGAAGIAAATAARERGLSAIILEASDRVGGRARTTEWQGHALDLGATWLHSAARNPLVQLAGRLRVDIDRSPARWRDQYKGLGFSEQEQQRSWEAMEAFAARLRTNPPTSDRASDALEADGEWNGFLEALNGYLNGTSLAHVSAADFMAYWDSSENSNWRLPRGLGTLIGVLASSLDVRTGCALQRVEQTGTTVRLVTQQGAIEAKRAVVAVPTTVLAAGDIAFDPPLDERLHAAAQLPLGRVEKSFFSLPDPETLPENGHLIGSPRSAETGSYMLRPLGMPVIEGFFGGDWLEGLTPEDLAAKARDELSGLLGSHFARSLSAVAHSDWKHERFIRGSYSFARPGRHGCRAALAAPIDGPLAFAGEACSTDDFATVHGAWASGRAAFEQLFPASE